VLLRNKEVKRCFIFPPHLTSCSELAKQETQELYLSTSMLYVALPINTQNTFKITWWHLHHPSFAKRSTLLTRSTGSCARNTIQLLQSEILDFLSPKLWPTLMPRVEPCQSYILLFIPSWNNACRFVCCNPWKGKGRTMYGMFFMWFCFWVVLSCLVFVQENLKALKT